MTTPCKPSDPARWSMLGLADPLQSPHRLEHAQTADLLAYARMLPGSKDPVEGIVDGVRMELEALAGSQLTDEFTGQYTLPAQRPNVAMRLLRRCDNRAPTPAEHDPDAPTADAGPDERNIAPGQDGGA
jgi:hypothetical protein